MTNWGSLDEGTSAFCTIVFVFVLGADVRVHKGRLEGKGWRDDSPSTCIQLSFVTFTNHKNSRAKIH